jgi:ornithine decarboxylase
MSILEKTLPITVIHHYILEKKPTVPTYVLNKTTLSQNTVSFIQAFNGNVLYSVKSNPDLKVLRYLYEAGIRHFDVASLVEVKLIAEYFPDCTLYFMHPIKPLEVIREAYFKYGVKIFSLDSEEELAKILQATDYATDLSLHVRIATSNTTSAFNLSTKFGIPLNKAGSLICNTRAVAKEFGICFHVGSQCMNPCEYLKAISEISTLMHREGINLNVLDIGGGFPVSYPNMKPLELPIYLTNINKALDEVRLLFPDCSFWAEPGRVLVAEAESLLVRVEARKGNYLYINDGTYGGLFDAGTPNFIYPVVMYKGTTASTDQTELLTDELELEAFSFDGPTCDSLDFMQGPFMLPAQINTGDYIEVRNLGAYSKSLRTNFNGFNAYEQLILQ